VETLPLHHTCRFDYILEPVGPQEGDLTARKNSNFLPWLVAAHVAAWDFREPWDVQRPSGSDPGLSDRALSRKEYLKIHFCVGPAAMPQSRCVMSETTFDVARAGSCWTEFIGLE
jgi:hypothetical protein